MIIVGVQLRGPPALHRHGDNERVPKLNVPLFGAATCNDQQGPVTAIELESHLPHNDIDEDHARRLCEALSRIVFKVAGCRRYATTRAKENGRGRGGGGIRTPFLCYSVAAGRK